jgi:UDP:flavonoid glycosyltransferase YjiC (YdhE family)
MRVLFTSTGGDGHLLPMLPLAGAFAARGDDVVVAVPANHRERVERLGLRFEQTGPTLEELHAETEAHRARIAHLPPAELRPAAFTGRFAEIEAPRRVKPLHRLVEREQPDVLVHEPGDLAAPIAATANGVPVVLHAFGRPIPEGALRQAAEEIAPMWQAAGLEPDELAGAYIGSYVDICPPSLRVALPRTPSRTHLLRPADAAFATDGARDRPLVYATLGTVFNEPRIFRLLLDAFEAVDCDVIMTIGRNRDPRDLEPTPGNVTVEQYIPQGEILAGCDAVVAHAGSGSMLAALAHGRPLVLVPMGADQFENASACRALGVAETILPADFSVERVREAVQHVVEGGTYAETARSVAAEIAAMPTAAVVAEEIAAQR